METRFLLPSLGMNMVFSPLSREEEPEVIPRPLTTSPSSILSNQSDKNKEAIRHWLFVNGLTASFSLQFFLLSPNNGEALNIPQADEKDRIMERKEIMLFDFDAYREAIINAFLHNQWANLNEPMITFFNDRIEILSRGSLAPLQTINGFYEGHSVPVNDYLSEMFLRLHISEKTGRGVPTIISKYWKRSIKISNNTIIVTIPFNRINEVGDKVGDKSLNNSEIKVLAEIRNNPNVTKPQLEVLCNLGKTSIDNCISLLKKKKYIERVGARKNGYWKVIEDTNVGDK